MQNGNKDDNLPDIDLWCALRTMKGQKKPVTPLDAPTSPRSSIRDFQVSCRRHDLRKSIIVPEYLRSTMLSVLREEEPIPGHHEHK
jgi:hypothetical protein